MMVACSCLKKAKITDALKKRNLILIKSGGIQLVENILVEYYTATES